MNNFIKLNNINKSFSNHKNLSDLAMQYMKGNDCLKEVVGMDNWDQKKTKVVSWMMRTWAKSYCMELKA